MKLVAEVKDETLLFDLVHELGRIFYRRLGKETYEVVYFSGSRVIHYVGKLSKEKLELLKSVGFEVSEIEIKEIEDIIKVVQ